MNKAHVCDTKKQFILSGIKEMEDFSLKKL